MNQPVVAGTPAAKVADSVQRGFDAVVSAQKQILPSTPKAAKSATRKA
jgi:hypothetical protein